MITGSLDSTGQRRTDGPTDVPRVVHEVRRADEKLVSLVQERPIATLCAAAVVGYLIGRIFTRLS